MDDMVLAALRKWPNVPDCRGWLGLDARGDWYMRDDATQAAGPFPRSKGSRIQHDKLRAFIERNYLPDPEGAWYFQNGPQRVYVELEAAPWVWRLSVSCQGSGEATPTLLSHTGQPATCESVWLDEMGRLFLQTDLGLGLVHTQDMTLAADAVTSGHWIPQDAPFASLPQKFGYVLSPAQKSPGS